MKNKRVFLLNKYVHPTTTTVGVFQSEKAAKDFVNEHLKDRLSWVYWADRNEHEGRSDNGDLFYISESILFG